jgi:hypothetical protein
MALGEVLKELGFVSDQQVIDALGVQSSTLGEQKQQSLHEVNIPK